MNVKRAAWKELQRHVGRTFGNAACHRSYEDYRRVVVRGNPKRSLRFGRIERRGFKRMLQTVEGVPERQGDFLGRPPASARCWRSVRDRWTCR